MDELNGIEKTRESLNEMEVDETLQFLQELESLHSGSVSPNDRIVAPGERECPICKAKMVSQGKEGVTVDACAKHGLWLDAGELEAIINRLRRGARINKEHAYKMGYKKGYADGMSSSFGSGG